LWFASERIFVLAESDARMKRFLEAQANAAQANAAQANAARAKTGALDQALRAAPKHLCVVGVAPSGEQREQWVRTLKTGLTAAGSPQPRADLDERLQCIRDLQAVSLTLDWVLRTAVGDVLKADVHFTFANEAGGQRAVEALQDMRLEGLQRIKAARDA